MGEEKTICNVVSDETMKKKKLTLSVSENDVSRREGKKTECRTITK